MSGEAGLYLHLPFCRRKCPYCHFFVLPDNETHKNALQKGLKLEWELASVRLAPFQITSVYFGGGTPALFGPHRIAELLALISPSQSAEITLEANPEDVTPELMHAYRASGINRVSIGVQSLDDQLLQKLGRTHTAEGAEKAVTHCKEAGFDNIAIDLMYDIPSQTLSQFENTLARATLLPITHLSLYNLTIEPGTLFFKQKGNLTFPREEESFAMLQTAITRLEQAGLHRYEISAFARPGYKAHHNTGYWLGRPFWGLGPSAFSYMDQKRFRNVCNLKRYSASLAEGKLPIDFEERLPYPESLHELLAINLRLFEGVDLQLFEKERGALPPQTHETLSRLISEGYLEKNERYRLTEHGRLFYDTVASEIV